MESTSDENRDEPVAVAATELSRLRRLESVAHASAEVVHDLNNLLTPILHSAELLLDELPSNSRGSELAADIRSATVRAVALARQVLRLTSGAPAERDRCDVGAVLSDMSRLLQRMLPTGVELVLRLSPEPLEVVVDRHQLERAVINLVVNARDAMPRGGRITVATSLCPRQSGGPEGAADDALDARSYVRISVTDTGTGILPSVRERVFEPRFTTKGDSGGTGLGLASVNKFARLNGGCVSLHSEVGNGTCAMLLFPRATDDIGPVNRAAREAR